MEKLFKNIADMSGSGHGAVELLVISVVVFFLFLAFRGLPVSSHRVGGENRLRLFSTGTRTNRQSLFALGGGE